MNVIIGKYIQTKYRLCISYDRTDEVLILIVMEDALRRQKYITSDNERITDLYYNSFTKFY